jgi:hypothetical protein
MLPATRTPLPTLPTHVLTGESAVPDRPTHRRRAPAERRRHELSLTKQTVSFHLDRLGAPAPIGYTGRRAVSPLVPSTALPAS